MTEGLDFKDLTVGTVLCCGEAELEISQIGKECHKSCAIRQATETALCQETAYLPEY